MGEIRAALLDPLGRDLDIFRVDLEADRVPALLERDDERRPGAGERVEDEPLGRDGRADAGADEVGRVGCEVSPLYGVCGRIQTSRGFRVAGCPSI